ncbi:MAG: hypothetical protein K2J11_07950 [Oscillospiraceae bacterium]|nr:hypothetical protein [Oscillospiraceae bacterium]
MSADGLLSADRFALRSDTVTKSAKITIDFSAGQNWILAVAIGAVGLFGLFVIIANWSALIAWYTKRKTGSVVPFFGGALAAFALSFTALRSFWWVCLAADYGFWVGLFSLPELIYYIFILSNIQIRHCPPN